MGKSHIVKTMLIAFVVSIELVAALIPIFIFFQWPWLMERVGELFSQRFQEYCILIGLPLGGLIFGFPIAQSLLHPADAEKKGLYSWPDYRLMRYYTYIPLVLTGLGFITPVLFLFTHDKLSKILMGTVYSAVTLSWMISIATLAIAKLNIDAILGGAD
jgi:hypothetical protein